MALCEICGSESLRCNCASTTPYCDTCNESDKCNMEMDTACVVYHPKYPGVETSPTKLSNLNMPNGSSAEKIFEAIDKFLGNNANVPITEQDSNTINLTATGVAKHTLKADVKVSATQNNQLEVKTDGLYAKPHNENYLVKVNPLDIPDYLQNQITGGTDMIVSISVVESGGILSIQPTLNIQCLLNTLANNQNFVNLICTVKQTCEGNCADISSINLQILTS